MNKNGVMVINRGLETRTSKTGRVRRTIKIEAEPMTIVVNPKALGQPVANQIANHYRERIRGIAATASEATLRARKIAEKAFLEGKSWATRRYSGGRIGSLPPNQSDRMFNDSGRFADSIVANASSDGAWRINVAANRLDDRTAGASGVDRIWNRLIELVPEFGNVALLFENAILKRTIERVSRERISVGKVASKAVTQFQAFAASFLGSGGG